jgi:uncharacterized membrane protein YjjB (DUF3815 family)
MSGALPWWLLLQNAFWAGLAALGFAILFNVPKRTLFACALSGAIAYAIRTLVMQFSSAGVEAATLAGATAVGFLGVGFGRLWRAPAPVFIVPGVIPLVPGSLAFKTMIDILSLVAGDAALNEALLAETAVNSLKTILIVAAIAGGIVIPSLLLRRRQPMT